MKSRIRTHKKRTREETPDLSSVPSQGMLQERSFAVQGKVEKPDLKTSLMRAERYGHNLDRMQPTVFQATQAVQLMGKNKPKKQGKPQSNNSNENKGGQQKKPQSDNSKKNLAQEHKQEQIKPYLYLLDHLAGETKGKDEVSGGHLFTEMQKKWDTKLKIIKEQSVKTNQVWNLEWTLGQRTPKNSTMFPKSWTKQDLEKELLGSSLVNKQLQLKSGITIKKSGDTFYPIAITEKPGQSSKNQRTKEKRKK